MSNFMPLSENSKSELNNCISNVKKGSQNDFSFLLGKYEPLISSMLSKFALKSAENGYVLTAEDIEDVRQEISVVFYNAVITYDIGVSAVEFGLYAKICINRALISLLRKQSRNVMIDTVSLQADIDFLDESDVPPAEYYRQKEDAGDLLRLIENSLSEYENKVWKLYLRGFSTKEIAAKLSKDVSSIDNAVFRIRSKLRSILKK